MPTLKLIKSNIDKTTYTGKTVDYFDPDLKGFGLRVGKEAKSYFARKEVAGKAVRLTIGKHGVWTADMAREEARKLLRQMEQGVDPREEEKAARSAAITLGQAFDAYLTGRKLKVNTLRNYERVRDIYLKEWAGRGLAGITRLDVREKHRQLTTENGPGQADQSFEIFRAVWNDTFIHMEDPPACPTKVLSAARQWNEKKRRNDRLRPEEFPQFMRSLRFLRQAHHDGYLLLLHTGMRSEEVACLRWENVNLEGGYFKAVDTKNGTDLTLPLCSAMWQMMKERKENAINSPYVFAGHGKGGNIVLSADHLHKLGFGVTVHGLRRTFRYLCERLHFPQGTIKRLMNHSLRSDITDSYLELEIEDLRPYVERIGEEIKRLSTYSVADSR